MSKHCKFADLDMMLKRENGEITNEEFQKWYDENCGKCIHMCEICMYGIHMCAICMYGEE